ncbi:hypothetical protein [Hymenobacter metallicola]|uniref:GAF domain-containing protein n=1 Tax=Hymenobacter metallicola TaxID=2563114 RepID=A0A4Z0PU95_9BACT|nr:hypothetical protein [Hymenobacter metallicola]TGE21065.1 hypothetical protein E5K02_23935 [Hymenobacter metallicola]
MTSPSEAPDALMQREIGEFAALLRQQGVHAALRYLNGRTPHQYTGVFRFDADMLRNVALFDRFQPTVQKGGDAPMGETYCSLVGQQQAPLEITDASVDPRVQGVISTPVVSYCGVLIRDTQGKAFGTLCHYDMQRCEERTTDMPLLQAAAGMLYQYLG